MRLLIRKLLAWGMVAAGSTAAPWVQADLVLTSPPRESAERGQEVYGPLAELLSRELGVTVIYEHPFDWTEYATKMRADRYDIIFDGPHFAAWRMKHLRHVPVVKLPGTLSFVVIGDGKDVKQKQLRDIITGRMCGPASPNLGTLAVLAQFDNPIIQPDLYEVADITATFDLLRSGKCSSAVVQQKALGRLSESDLSQFKVLYTSGTFPEQTVTVSRRVTDRQRAVLAELLTRPSGIEATTKLLAQYARQARSFEVASQQDYAGLENLLEGVLWGW
jgi:ABC-type phosphate/phosphonate transport system substrate-binding protein